MPTCSSVSPSWTSSMPTFPSPLWEQPVSRKSRYLVSLRITCSLADYTWIFVYSCHNLNTYNLCLITTLALYSFVSLTKLLVLLIYHGNFTKSSRQELSACQIRDQVRIKLFHTTQFHYYCKWSNNKSGVIFDNFLKNLFHRKFVWMFFLEQIWQSQGVWVWYFAGS